MIGNSEKNIGVEIKLKFKLVELWLKFISNSLKLSRKSCDRNFLFRLVTLFHVSNSLSDSSFLEALTSAGDNPTV